MSLTIPTFSPTSTPLTNLSILTLSPNEQILKVPSSLLTHSPKPKSMPLAAFTSTQFVSRLFASLINPTPLVITFGP